MRALFVILALCVVARPAAAGIVNMTSVLGQEAPEGVSGSFTGSADWRTGNVDLLVLSATPLVRYRHHDHLLILTAKGELGRSKGERIISRTFEHARYRYEFTELVTGETFAQHEYDEFRRLELRALVGAGPKFDLVRRDQFGLSVGVAYMLEYEQLNDSGFADDGDTDLQHRISSYAVGTFQIKDDLQLAETVYFQPRLDEADDMRLLSDTALTIQVTKALSFTSSLSIAWDTAPPLGVEELDTQLKSAITYAF